MKKLILGSIACLIVVVGAYLVGRWMERAKSGYHYQVLEEKEIAFAAEPIHWKSVAEYVGLPFLEPETTLIEVDGRIIYKAKRIFQESFPFARNVRVHDGLIEWDDAEYSFTLKMQKMPPGSSVATPATTSASVVPMQRTGETQPDP